MATKPKYSTLTNSSVDVLNAIRNSASTDYKDYVPVATNDDGVIKNIGNIIMDYPNITNEFVGSLVNRIARVLISSKMFHNPWEVFKSGKLDIGESIEDIFIDLSKPFAYDAEASETDVFKRVSPNASSSFYVVNYQTYYKQTIEEEQLSRAFISVDGVTNFIAGLVDQMYSAAYYDEFNIMKYTIARNIIDGRFPIAVIDEVTEDTINNTMSKIKGYSNDFVFKNNAYNPAGVYNNCEKNDQYLISTSSFSASIDVMSLAKAFNMDKAEFTGHNIMVDSFGTLDTERIKTLIGDNPQYKEITTTQIAALKKIGAILIDRDFFKCFDRVEKFTEIYNGQGLYWNYFYHVWKIIAASPFANRVAFGALTPSITSVTVSPASLTMDKGTTTTITPSVIAVDFAPQSVTWTSDNDDVTVNGAGVVSVGASASGTAKIKATSTYDATKSATCTITIS